MLYEFYKAGAEESELTATHNKLLGCLEDIEFRNMLSEEGDELSAVQIMRCRRNRKLDWAEMLMRMYLMWAEKQGFKSKSSTIKQGMLVGLKLVPSKLTEILLLAKRGKWYIVWCAFLHLIVMQNVTPLLFRFSYPLVDDSIEIINPADISWKPCVPVALGAKCQQDWNGCSPRHSPSGIMIENSETRSQLKIKPKPCNLKSQLYEIELQKKMAARDEIEASKNRMGSQRIMSWTR